MLYLQSHPSVRYYGWELDEAMWSKYQFMNPTNMSIKRWASRTALHLLQQHFPDRCNVTFGDAHRDILPFFAARPALRCNVLSVDGDHSFSGVMSDLEQLGPRLDEGGLILVDDNNAHSPKKGPHAPAALWEAYAKYVTSGNGTLASGPIACGLKATGVSSGAFFVHHLSESGRVCSI